MPGRLAAWARTQPDHPAVRDAGATLTFGALWRSTTTMATGICSRLSDATRPEPVAVLADPGRGALEAISAVLAAGHTALVLDPDAPPDLLRLMVGRSGTRLVVTGVAHDRASLALFPRIRGALLADLRTTPPAPLPPVHADAPAVLLTRTTADGPRLVAIPHHALDARLAETARQSSLTPADRVAHLFGPWSEVGLVSLLAPLTVGSTVITLGAWEGPTLPDRLVDEEATALIVTPTLVGLIEGLGPVVVPSLRTTIVLATAPGPQRHDLIRRALGDPANLAVVPVTTDLLAHGVDLATGPVWSPPPPTLAERALGGAIAIDARLVERHFPLTDRSIDPFTLASAPSIAARWGDIRAELDSLLEAGIEMPDIDEVNGEDQGAEGPWTTYVLYAFGSWIESNAARCPATAALVAAVPDVEIAGFTVLAPGTHIPAHRGPYRALRYQLGVKVPAPVGTSRLRVAREVLVWEDAKSLAFDDAVEHEAWNDADAPRYVFFVQTAWPLPGWSGRGHRLIHRGLARAGRPLAARAARLDAALNGPG